MSRREVMLDESIIKRLIKKTRAIKGNDINDAIKYLIEASDPMNVRMMENYHKKWSRAPIVKIDILCILDTMDYKANEGIAIDIKSLKELRKKVNEIDGFFR